MKSDPRAVRREGLGATALRAAPWSAIYQVADWGLRLLFSLLLARLIGPADFGLVALGMVLVHILENPLDHGLTEAVQQRSRLDPIHFHSAFWARLFAGLAMMLLLWASAEGLAARVFRSPELAPVLRGLSLMLGLSPMRMAFESLLKREMDFRSLAWRTAWSRVAAGAVAVAMTVAGFGLWGLVAFHLASAGLSGALLWRVSSWKPLPSFSLRSYRELLRFSLPMLGIKLLHQAGLYLDRLLVGVFIGATMLGFFAAARGLVVAAGVVLTSALFQVLWPAFARLQEDRARLRQALYEAAEGSALVLFPLFFGLMAVAPELVLALLGEAWKPSVPLVRAFCVGGAARAASGVAMVALAASGGVGRRLRVETATTLVTAAALVAAVPWGAVAIAWAGAGAAIVMLPVRLWVAGQRLQIDGLVYLRRQGVFLVCSLLMAVAVIAIGRVLLTAGLQPAVRLPILVAIGALLYGAAALVAGRRVFGALLDTLSESGGGVP